MQKLLSAASSTALIIALICIWAAAGGGGLHANEGFCTVFCLCLGEFLHSEQVVFMLHEVGGWFTEKGKGKKKHAALGIAGPLRHKTSRESHECSVCQDWLYTEKKEKDRHHHRQVVRALRIHSSTSKDSVMAFPREYIILGEFLGVFYSFRLRGSAYRAQTTGNIFYTFLASESSRLLSYPVRKRKKIPQNTPNLSALGVESGGRNVHRISFLCYLSSEVVWSRGSSVLGRCQSDIPWK